MAAIVVLLAITLSTSSAAGRGSLDVGRHVDVDGASPAAVAASDLPTMLGATNVPTIAGAPTPSPTVTTSFPEDTPGISTSATGGGQTCDFLDDSCYNEYREQTFFCLNVTILIGLYCIFRTYRASKLSVPSSCRDDDKEAKISPDERDMEWRAGNTLSQFAHPKLMWELSPQDSQSHIRCTPIYSKNLAEPHETSRAQQSNLYPGGIREYHGQWDDDGEEYDSIV